MNIKKKIVSFLTAAAIAISIAMPASSAYAVQSTSQNNLSTVEMSNIRPQDDFYEAVNGEWKKSAVNHINEFYGEKSAYSDIRDNNEEIIKNEFANFIYNKNKYGENSDERKMADIYLNYINIEERNSQGIEPIKKYIEKIDSVTTMEDLNNLLGNPEIDLLNNLIRFTIQENYNSTAYEVYIEPTSLSLMDSSRYNNANSNDEYYSKVRKFYMSLLQKAGYSESESSEMIYNMFTFEQYLSKDILSSNIDENQRDKSKCDVLFKVNELDTLAPNIKLSKIMKSLKIDNANYIKVSEVDWLKRLDYLWTPQNLSLIKNYMKLNLIKSTGRYLTEDMGKTYFDFIGSLLDMDFSYDSIEDEAYGKVSSLFPLSLGKLYQDKTLSKAEIEDVQSIANEVMNTYKNKISNCNWLSDTTKVNFIDKLSKIKMNIGYSNSNQDYSAADIKLYSQGGSLLENIMNLGLAAKNNQLRVLNQSIKNSNITDEILPQEVVAEYHMLKNTIVITPGMLQPELYDINYSREKKLAGIGFVIAHEIGHSLDIYGAFFDGEGNLKNMWTDEDFNKYKQKVLYIKDYYSAIEGLPGKYVDGELTLCENIADIEAMSCILDLLEKSESIDYKLFFESYARAYRCVKTKEEYENALESEEHSPDKIRVNIVLAQFQKFYDTYGIGADDHMYVNPDYRITPLW